MFSSVFCVTEIAAGAQCGSQPESGKAPRRWSGAFGARKLEARPLLPWGEGTGMRGQRVCHRPQAGPSRRGRPICRLPRPPAPSPPTPLPKGEGGARGRSAGNLLTCA
jgi:hypothetical protein